MYKFFCAAVIALLVVGVVVGPAQALSVDLYVDAAPNAYGSPNWAPWWSQAQQDAVAGTFENMRSGYLGLPGELLFHPYDMIVYSDRDLGHRLHWIYWVPEETTASLDGLFEVRMVVDWAGVDYTYDWGSGGILSTDLDTGWVQPGSWSNYDDGTDSGVIGTFGHAWWATNDQGQYTPTTQADVDALAALVFQNQTYARGEVRWRTSTSDDWTYMSPLQVDIIPEPATMTLLGLGLGGLAVRRYRSKRKG